MKGVRQEIVYYPQQPKEFGEILKTFVGEARASSFAAYYESLQKATEYPSKFNPEKTRVLGKIPVKMTSLQEWAKESKGCFIQ